MSQQKNQSQRGLATLQIPKDIYRKFSEYAKGTGFSCKTVAVMMINDFVKKDGITELLMSKAKERIKERSKTIEINKSETINTSPFIDITVEDKDSSYTGMDGTNWNTLQNGVTGTIEDIDEFTEELTSYFSGSEEDSDEDKELDISDFLGKDF